MRDITVLFTTSNKKFSIFSKLIRWWTNKAYSHVAVKFNTKHIFDSDTYYQASEGLVNYMSEPQFKKKHKIVFEEILTIPEEQYWQIRKACHHEAGVQYGFMQNIGIALVDILEKVNIKKDNPWKKGRNCSELLYTKVIKPIFGNLGYNPDTIKPHHIEEILNKHINKDNKGE